MNPETTCYKARWIYPVSTPPVENGIVAVSQGEIVSIGQGGSSAPKGSEKVIDLGDGVIFPALINAHTHLDLAALQGRLEPGLGFLEWVRGLLSLRLSLTDDELRAHIQKACLALHHNGTIAAGDWTNRLGLDGVGQSGGLIRGVFYEIIGFSESTLTLPESLASNSTIDNRQSTIEWLSLGAHAPHTTSPALLKAAKEWTKQKSLPLSIHVAESIEEEEFLFTGQGPWQAFLVERGKWSRDWVAPGVSPVAYLDSLGILDEKTLCVHLTRASSRDLQLLKKKQSRAVVCPRSNYFISRSLPPVPEMLRLGMTPALGTDSLASNQDLNLWEEMAFLHRSFPDITPEDILKMATLNGARALDLEEKLGSLSTGKRAEMIFLPLDGGSIKELPEVILFSHGKDLRWIV
jgi:aminodeoxyfutalosine deaminase